VYNADTVSCVTSNHLAVKEAGGSDADFVFISETLEMDGQNLVDSGRFRVFGGSFECLPDPPNPNALSQVNIGFTLEIRDGSGESQSFQSDIFLRDY